MLAACSTTTQPLYYWGDYQPQVYRYFQAGGQADIGAQIQKLEQTAQQAHAKSSPLPPGFNAHLGLLYLHTGHVDQARQAFLAEEAQFPESKPYLDFLLGKMNQQSRL